MVLVAVSGGRDSMVLAEKVRRNGGPFAIAHCNFRLRGADSDADEALVRAWATRHGVTCHVRAFDTEACAEAEGISIEMAARKLRYRWFGELCREHGYEAVLTAHHAGDNAETFFLNLLRGSGIKGLCGMAEDGFLPDPDYADIPLRRPLLHTTRAEIDALAAAWNLPWREDRTNAENTVKRNKLRNQVFPVLREINPSFEETLAADMDRLRLVEKIADGYYREHVDLVWDGRRVDTDLLKTIPGWEYILYRILEGEGMEAPLIAQATDIVRSGQSGRRAGTFISATGRLVREEAVGAPEIEVTEEPWDPGRSPVMPEGVLAVDEAPGLVQGPALFPRGQEAGGRRPRQRPDRPAPRRGGRRPDHRRSLQDHVRHPPDPQDHCPWIGNCSRWAWPSPGLPRGRRSAPTSSCSWWTTWA